MSAAAQPNLPTLEQYLENALGLAAEIVAEGRRVRDSDKPNAALVVRALAKGADIVLKCASLEAKRNPLPKAERKAPTQKPEAPKAPKTEKKKFEPVRDEHGNPYSVYRPPQEQYDRGEIPNVGMIIPTQQKLEKYSVDFRPVWWGPGSGELNDWEIERANAIIFKRPIPLHPYELRGQPRPVHPYNSFEPDPTAHLVVAQPQT